MRPATAPRTAQIRAAPGRGHRACGLLRRRSEGALTLRPLPLANEAATLRPPQPRTRQFSPWRSYRRRPAVTRPKTAQRDVIPPAVIAVLSPNAITPSQITPRIFPSDYRFITNG